MPDGVLEVLPEQAIVLEDLRPLLPSLRRAVLGARDRRDRNPPDNLLVHTATTTAGCMVNYMVTEARLAFAGEPRVSFKDDEETWLVIDQRYDLRFKKMRDGGVPQNADTHRQRLITSQRSLPGFHLIRLNAGWDEDFRGEFRVLVSFSNAMRSVGWCVELREDGVYSLVGHPILPFADGLPMHPPPADPFDLANAADPDVQAPRRRVRPRTPPAPAEEERPRRVRPAGSAEHPDHAGSLPARQGDE